MWKSFYIDGPSSPRFGLVIMIGRERREPFAKETNR